MTDKMTDSGQAIQKTFRFHGNVQGVGFRYTACRVAGRYDLTGYVRNLPDQSVECLVEGGSDQIQQFRQSLEAEMGGYIHETTEQTAEPSGQYDTFGVRY